MCRTPIDPKLLRELGQAARELVGSVTEQERRANKSNVVNLFVYLTDVPTDGEGPFTFVPPAPSRKVRGLAAAHLPDSQFCPGRRRCAGLR